MDNLNPYTFFFELPLYTPIYVNNENIASLKELLVFNERIDAYNPSLKENTTYQIYQLVPSSYLSTYLKDGGIRKATLNCVRSGEEFSVYANYDSDLKILQKIGQFPSIAYLHISQIKKYDKVLSKEKSKEFTRAIGLAANGVGIGSFVYLRRIFEGLIEEAYKVALANKEADEKTFHNLRMSEKIEVLKSYLPSFLVENKSLYSILSLGIHELKEDDCLTYFETVKVGIELILDEKVEIYEKKKKLDEARKKISTVNNSLNKT